MEWPYWLGVDPQSSLAQDIAHALHTSQQGKVVPRPEAAKAFAFWNVWHTYLRNEGVDFVKVDYQSGLISFWNHEQPIGKVAKNAYGALEASVGKHFDGTVINCVGMASENIWHRQTALTRNSDDFFPKSEGRFIAHAVMRAVSGGPVYISDEVGDTNAEQIWSLILADGRVLHGDVPGMTTEDCLLCDPSKHTISLKLWNCVGDVGIVAAFNIHREQEVVVGEVCATDIPDLEGDYFVAYEYFSQTACRVGYDEAIKFELMPNQAVLYSFISYAGTYTSIALSNKYLSSATVVDWFRTEDHLTVLLL